MLVHNFSHLGLMVVQDVWWEVQNDIQHGGLRGQSSAPVLGKRIRRNLIVYIIWAQSSDDYIDKLSAYWYPSTTQWIHALIWLTPFWIYTTSFWSQWNTTFCVNVVTIGQVHRSVMYGCTCLLLGAETLSRFQSIVCLLVWLYNASVKGITYHFWDVLVPCNRLWDSCSL